MTTREKTIAELLKNRESLHRDLTTCGRHKVGSEWWTDRVREMQYTNSQLERLGVIPKLATAE